MDIKLNSCRICLQEGFKNIFEEDNIPICKKIVYCASVQVSQDDLLPKLICDQCLFYLDIAFAFKKECESTDNRLRNLLRKKQINTDNIEITSTTEYAGDVIKIEENKLGDGSVLNDLVEQYSDSIPISDEFKPKESNTDTSEIVVEAEDCQEHKKGSNFVSKRFKQKVLNKGKVGRHIAKKITGKLPQRLHQFSSAVCDNTLDVLKIENSNKDLVQFDENVEDNVPVVGSEETVTTEDVHPTAVNKNQENNAEIVCKKQEISEAVEAPKRRIRKKLKVKLKMTLRKGNRKVNVFKDYFKDIKQKQKEGPKDLKSTDREIVSKKFQKTKDGFICDICNKSFPYRSHLKRHLNKHTGVKLYSCELCNQKFVNNYNLSVHMSKHTGEFPLQCEICNRGLPNPSLLKRHMISHTGERKFHCRYCPATFRQSSSLKSHEKMHLNRPSYHCDICFKVFSYTNSLTAHKKLHFGTQRFSCDICLSTFSRKSSLVRHMGEHVKSKRIKCKVCDLSFHSKISYNSHLKSHCKYKCVACGEGFKYKSNFNEHVKNHELHLKPA